MDPLPQATWTVEKDDLDPVGSHDFACAQELRRDVAVKDVDLSAQPVEPQDQWSWWGIRKRNGM